jgi:hypothetical protein
MSEKPIAVVLTGIGVVSLCAVCALGPVVLGSAAGWAFSWVTDLSPMATVGVTIFAALVAYALFWRWGAAKPRECSEPATHSDSPEGESQ